MIENKEVLIVGGTGSLGKTILKKLLKHHKCKGIRIFSRSEFNQWKLRNEIDELKGDNKIAYLLGDIRDAERLRMAMDGVDIVYNTAAMKQLPACEDNPIEAIRINIDGAINVINTSREMKVEKVINISTDKAVSPIQMYGCTKAVAEKLFVFANVYTPHSTKYACCRYGNVLGSNGSILQLFHKQVSEGKKITVTHKDMTRFFITLNNVAEFVIEKSQEMKGGEIFIPKMKSIKIDDFVSTLYPGVEVEYTGIRNGEKLHECLINKEESAMVQEKDDCYIIHKPDGINAYHDLYYYDSNIAQKMTEEDLREMIKG